jgi:hypothetical protein
MEVTRIVKNAALPPGGFSLPAGYAVVIIYYMDVLYNSL